MGISGISGGSEYGPTPSGQNNKITHLVDKFLSDPSDKNVEALSTALDKFISDRNTPEDQRNAALDIRTDLQGISDLSLVISMVREELKQPNLPPEKIADLTAYLQKAADKQQFLEMDMQEACEKIK